MNKLIINHLEKLIVTADSATILKEMEVQHPAAKMLVLAAHMQEQEVPLPPTPSLLGMAGLCDEYGEGMRRAAPNLEGGSRVGPRV